MTNSSTQRPFLLGDEQHLTETYQQYIAPFWNACHKGQFNGKDAITIEYAYAIHPQAIGCIMISSGRIESMLKYKEVMYDLYQNGYSVFIHDHRGQGLSGRMCKNSHKGYVADFDDYVEDMKYFYNHVVAPNSDHTPMLLCHSMGSAIGAQYLLKYTADFSRVAFCSPMFGIKAPIPEGVARLIIRLGLKLNGWLSSEPMYFIGQGNYLELPFKINPLTHSEKRYQQLRDSYQQSPETKLGGVTFKWLQQALRAMDSIEQHAKQLALPTLLLQAGAEKIVDNRKQDKIASLLPQGKKHTLSGANHELLMETDAHRQQAMTLILEFFSD